MQPMSRLAHCSLKWLVNYREGTFTGVDEAGLQTILTDPSYRGHQIFIHPGNQVKKTQNCFTWGGCVLLANRDEAAMEAIYNK